MLSEFLHAKSEYMDIVLLLLNEECLCGVVFLMFLITSGPVIMLKPSAKPGTAQCVLCHSKVKFTL